MSVIVLSAELELQAAIGEYGAALEVVVSSNWSERLMEDFLRITCHKNYALKWAESAVKLYTEQGKELTTRMLDYLVGLYRRLGRKDKMLEILNRIKVEELPLTEALANHLINFFAWSGLLTEGS